MKLSLQFRGREIEMQSIGRDLFQVRSDRSSRSSNLQAPYGAYADASVRVVQKFVDDVGSEAAVASKPEMQGRIMSMILTPTKA